MLQPANQEKMKEIAADLVLAVGGKVTKENIDGVIAVFKGVMQGCDNNWHNHLDDENNKWLTFNNVKCSQCGNKTQVLRTPTAIYVRNDADNQ